MQMFDVVWCLSVVLLIELWLFFKLRAVARLVRHEHQLAVVTLDDLAQRDLDVLERRVALTPEAEMFLFGAARAAAHPGRDRCARGGRADPDCLRRSPRR